MALPNEPNAAGAATTPSTTTIVGGPEEATPSAAPAQGGSPGGAAAATPAPASTPSFTPIFLNGKRFNTADELAVYTSKIEHDRAVLQAAMGQVTSAPGAQKETPKKLSDLMFEEPDAFVEELLVQGEERAYKRIRTEDGQRDALQNFYSAYPDLKGNEDLVDMYRGRMHGEIKDLPLADAIKKLGDAVRTRVSSLRGSSNTTTTELPGGQARTAGASGNPAPHVPAESKKTDFISQLQRRQQRNRK
jgi:hypothetical protein